MKVEIKKAEPTNEITKQSSFPVLGISKEDQEIVLFIDYGIGISLKAKCARLSGHYSKCWAMNNFVKYDSKIELENA